MGKSSGVKTYALDARIDYSTNRGIVVGDGRIDYSRVSGLPSYNSKKYWGSHWLEISSRGDILSKFKTKAFFDHAFPYTEDKKSVYPSGVANKGIIWKTWQIHIHNLSSPMSSTDYWYRGVNH